jgi:hypothetical protein
MKAASAPKPSAPPKPPPKPPKPAAGPKHTSAAG